MSSRISESSARNGYDVHEADIAIKGGKFAKIAGSIAAKDAKQVHDGKGRLAFPGVVDAHTHAGIYSPMAEDALTESRAAAQGGVTSMLNYFRTGQYYLGAAQGHLSAWQAGVRRRQGPGQAARPLPAPPDPLIAPPSPWFILGA